MMGAARHYQKGEIDVDLDGALPCFLCLLQAKHSSTLYLFTSSREKLA